MTLISDSRVTYNTELRLRNQQIQLLSDIPEETVLNDSL